MLARAAVAVEVVLILDFLICVILRTLDTKRTLMHTDDLEEMDKLLPQVLSTIMVVISVVIPLALLLWNRKPKREKVGTPGPGDVETTWNASQLKWTRGRCGTTTCSALCPAFCDVIRFVGRMY